MSRRLIGVGSKEGVVGGMNGLGSWDSKWGDSTDGSLVMSGGGGWWLMGLMRVW